MSKRLTNEELEIAELRARLETLEARVRELEREVSYTPTRLVGMTLKGRRDGGGKTEIVP